MDASEFIRANIHHGADHGGQKLAVARELQARVKADCRAVWKPKPACLDKISLRMRPLRGKGRPPECSRPADSIDNIVGELRRGPYRRGLRCRPPSVPTQPRADMIAARPPVVVRVAMNN